MLRKTIIALAAAASVAVLAPEMAQARGGHGFGGHGGFGHGGFGRGFGYGIGAFGFGVGLGYGVYGPYGAYGYYGGDCPCFLGGFFFRGRRSWGAFLGRRRRPPPLPSARPATAGGPSTWR